MHALALASLSLGLQPCTICAHPEGTEGSPHICGVQAMAVRAEEQEKLASEQGLDAARKFAEKHITELDESSMSELASACKAAGLEQLFLSAMKISK